MGHAVALAIGLAFAASAAQTPPPNAEKPAPASASKAKPEVRPTLAAPPPRAPIAGLAGFESRSRIEYPMQPGRLHELRAVYVFPDRVRWSTSAADGAAEQRRLRFRYGEHVLAVDAQASASVEYRAEDRAALIAAFEMRRALFLWPDGRTWAGEGELRKSALANGDELRAKLAGSPPRPVELEYRAATGEFHDTFRAITWRAAGARAWPATFEVWNGSSLAWRESVDAVDLETRFVDSFFVPPDRRGVLGAPVEGVRDLDIPPVCSRRIELPASTTWEAARAAEAREREEHDRARRPELEAWSTFEVRADGTPAAVVLRLAQIPERAPEGWSKIADRFGAASQVRGTGAVTKAVIEKVAARLPTGAVAGKAYVRFDPARAEPDVVVVVPVE